MRGMKYEFENKKSKTKYKNNKGVTLVDVTIAAIIISIFTGVIATLMYKSYAMAIEIEQTANANAYATIILEKSDEKPFDVIDDNFLSTIAGEIEVDTTKYRISFEANEIENNTSYQIEGEDIFKEVKVTVEYGKDFEKKITLKKLKVKEMGNM